MKPAHHRRPNRLRGKCYADPGMYFLTVCCQDRQSLLGSFRQGNLVLNTAGTMVYSWWFRLSGKFNRIGLHEFVVMPNHVHGIIRISPISVGEEPRADVGEDPRVLPYRSDPWVPHNALDNQREDPRVLPYRPDRDQPNALVDPTIPRIMQWFKTMTTNEFYRIHSDSVIHDSSKLWQRSYYDHIIRCTDDYCRIAEYIRRNPEKWILDRFHPNAPAPAII